MPSEMPSLMLSLETRGWRETVQRDADTVLLNELCTNLAIPCALFIQLQSARPGRVAAL